MRSPPWHLRRHKRLKRHDEIGPELIDREVPSSRHDPEHGVAAPRQVDLLTDNLRIAIKGGFPEVIGEEHDEWTSGSSFRRGIAATKHRGRPEHVEDFWGDG